MSKYNYCDCKMTLVVSPVEFLILRNVLNANCSVETDAYSSNVEVFEKLKSDFDTLYYTGELEEVDD